MSWIGFFSWKNIDEFLGKTATLDNAKVNSCTQDVHNQKNKYEQSNDSGYSKNTSHSNNRDGGSAGGGVYIWGISWDAGTYKDIGIKIGAVGTVVMEP